MSTLFDSPLSALEMSRCMPQARAVDGVIRSPISKLPTGGIGHALRG